MGWQKDPVFGLLHYDYGFRIYHPGLGRFLSVDPLADAAPDWTPYRFGFNNPLFFIDPDGLFETETAARKYAKDNGIRTGLFSRSRIIEQSDGTFSIDNKLQHTSISDLGGDLGIVTAVLITPDDLLQPTGENDSFWQTETIRKRSQEEPVFTDRIIFIPELGPSTKVVSRFVQAGFKFGKAKEETKPTAPYKRPNNATTKAQRESVQNKPCVDCGKDGGKKFADHIDPLVKEYYETGTIDKVKMRDVNSVQPQCPTCSSKQGAELSKYSKEQKKKLYGGD